jgi:chorismate dehydratase
MKTEEQKDLSQATIRIGHFEFLNGYPLYYGLEKGAGWGCFKLVNGVPTRLNRLLLEGELDISPVSSIEYTAHAGELLLFPRISITADGVVDSIQLLSGRPIDEIESVALTSQSATSVVLLKILLAQKYGLSPRYYQLKGGGDGVAEVLGRREAALLIGDEALRAHYLGEGMSAGGNGAAGEAAGSGRAATNEPAASGEAAGTIYSYDLGAEWKSFTGLPMVFALWAVRRRFFEQRPDETFEVEERLLYSVEYCREHWDEVVAAAARVYPFSTGLLRSYFQKLRYDLTDDYRRGLEEFYRRAVQIGAAPEALDLKFIRG